MKSILMALALTFSASAFAEITNGKYECSYELEADQDPSEAYSFVFDLSDEYMVVYDDDNQAIESILIIGEDPDAWITDAEGDKYKIERTFYALRITYSTISKDEVSGDVDFKNLTESVFRYTTDGNLLLNTTDTEIDVATGKVDKYSAQAICKKK